MNWESSNESDTIEGGSLGAHHALRKQIQIPDSAETEPLLQAIQQSVDELCSLEPRITKTVKRADRESA